MDFFKESQTLLSKLSGLQRTALIAGVVGLVLSAIGIFFGADQFFRSYLTAYIFWVQISIGGLIILMIHHVAGGKWSAVMQRTLEGTALVLPLMALLFVPILFGMQNLYPWARPEEVAHDLVLQGKAGYLNVPFFIVRAAIFFALWIGLAFALRRLSLERDRTGDPELAGRMKRLSAPGILLIGFTITFASVDWMMSLEPHWFSSIYGMKFGVGAFASAFSFVVVLLLALKKVEPFKSVITTKTVNDFGSFMLAAVMLWAYIAFSQYLIIWSGNLPEETPWYLTRTDGGWQWIGLSLIFIHFALPFIFLLSRGTRRSPALLGRIALLVLAMRVIDIFWLIQPAFYPKGLHVHWLDLTALIGIGGLWLANFVRNLNGKSLLPLNDVRLTNEMEHHPQQEASHVH